jgi:glycosyltransferase involved in cell wall biosynthesis
MDPGIPVPPVLYGGHERLVHLFAEKYQKLGHEVTLLAGPNSYCSGKTITFGINDLDRSTGAKNVEIAFVWKYLYNNWHKYELVHNFGRLIYLLPILNKKVNKIMTYGRPVSRRGVKIFTSLPNINLVFTACSNYCVSTGNVAGKWLTVYNAIDFSTYTLNTRVTDDAPLMFLGRIENIKGAHTAIQVAKATNNNLILAGNIPTVPGNMYYYKTAIEPQIDGKQIKYIGALNDSQKNWYLQRAKALLFPIDWDEPFGIVMIEAMACGTPVIAFKRGSVPEVITEGVTGFVTNTFNEMVDAVAQVNEIDRKACRDLAEKRFNAEKVTLDYLNLIQ